MSSLAQIMYGKLASHFIGSQSPVRDIVASFDQFDDPVSISRVWHGRVGDPKDGPYRFDVSRLEVITVPQASIEVREVGGVA